MNEGLETDLAVYANIWGRVNTTTTTTTTTEI
jgi:hypothetical protein